MWRPLVVCGRIQESGRMGRELQLVHQVVMQQLWEEVQDMDPQVFYRDDYTRSVSGNN